VAALAVVVVVLLVAGSVYQAIAGNVASDRYPPPGRMIDIGGRRLHLLCTGQGSPTVVLDAGLGDGLGTWRHVQPGVARTTRVCSYDRAGYGWSDPGPRPRTTRMVAADLDALLRASGERSPYVLVGHSLGGLFVRQYAEGAPAAVAGLVLVDSSHEEQEPPVALMRWTVRGLMAAGVRRFFFDYDDAGMDAVYSNNRTRAAIVDEFNAIAESQREARGRVHPSFGDRPLVVLTAGTNDSDWWRAFQRELTGRSRNSRQIIAEGVGHNVQVEAPALVVSAIADVVQQVRGDHHGNSAGGRPPAALARAERSR
jgi:pimeloyl-ACP methyl ester carboxylesterase